jgi:hypothetical protein
VRYREKRREDGEIVGQTADPGKIVGVSIPRVDALYEWLDFLSAIAVLNAGSVRGQSQLRLYEVSGL